MRKRTSSAGAVGRRVRREPAGGEVPALGLRTRTRAGAAAGALLGAFSDELAALTERARRATVAVAGPTAEGGSAGSGVFVDGRGHILTNFHVIEGMTPPIKITLHGGITALAGLVGADGISDLAVLRLDARWRHCLRLRRSPARAGELCLAIGNPLGRYPETVTIGVVSGLARTAVAGPGRPHYRLLQTDCDIHEGNSGGPLLDMRGRIIGINTLIDAETPYIGLSIPVSTVAPVLAELLKHGRVARASLGVAVARRSRTVGDTPLTGLEVVRLRRTKGQLLRVGDLILRIGQTEVTDPPALFDELGRSRIGVATPVTIVREGRAMTLTVKPWPYRET